MKSRGKSVFTNYVTDGMKSRKHFEKKNQTRKTNKKKNMRRIQEAETKIGRHGQKRNKKKKMKKKKHERMVE